METRQVKIIYVNACGPQKGVAVASNIPRKYSMRVSVDCSTPDLKALVAQAVGAQSKACCIIIARVVDGELFQVYAPTSTVRKFKPTDEIWAYELPKIIENNQEYRDAKEAIEGKSVQHENWISVQVAHKVAGIIKGKPFVIVVPESKIKVMPVGELRQIMREAMTPFLKALWQSDDEDVDLYSIYLMNKSGKEFIMRVPTSSSTDTVDLTTKTETKGFSFHLNWDRLAFESRYWDGVPQKVKVPFTTGLSQHMGQLLDSGDHSDVVLAINGTEIPAHKAILSARSPYFKAMFAHKMTESLEGVVRIEDVSVPAFRQLLRFIYTNNCDLSGAPDKKEDKDEKDEKKEEDEVDLIGFPAMMLAIADRFQVPELTSMCSEYLTANITVSTAAQLLIMADAMHATHLKQQVMQFICANSERRANIMDTDTFQKLSPALLHEMLIAVTPEAKKASKKRAREDDTSLIKSDVKKLKVSELRAELASRGLETGGMKVDLVERLENALTV